VTERTHFVYLGTYLSYWLPWFLIFSIVLLIFIGVIITDLLLKRRSETQRYYKWNIWIFFFYVTFQDIFTYILLEIRYYNFEYKDTRAGFVVMVVNFLLLIVCIALIIVGLLKST